MKKRIEKLMLMGILSIAILSTTIIVAAEDLSQMVETAAETEAVKEKKTVTTEAPVPATEAPAPVIEAPTPATEAPVPVTEAPATEVPTTEAPATEAPTTEAPATEAPTTEAPTTEAPGTEAPGTEAPGTEAPTTDAPATDMESTETPVIDIPATEGTEIESEMVESTETEKITVEDTSDGTVEIIDNSIDEEKIARIEAAVKKKIREENKKKEEEAKKLYQKRIGESLIDFNSYPVGNITENTNKIYDFLREEMGFNHAAACGILANIQCESNFSSTAVGDGGTSYGLCQWHLGRFTRLVNWCNANDYDYHLVDGQMRYLQYELENVYVDVYEYLLQVSDDVQGSYDAAYYWCAYYEMPSDTFARAKQRGNMAMTEFFPKELGEEELETEATQDETECILIVKDMLGEEEKVDLWNETAEMVFQMNRLNIPHESLLILE